jgi:hypothetical protein
MGKHWHLRGCVCLLCTVTVLTAETVHLSHVGVCLEKPGEPDLRPPQGCNEPGQPHSRNVSISTLATANSTGSSATVAMSLSPVVFDADDVRLDLQPPFTTEESGPSPGAKPLLNATLMRKIIDRSRG